MTKQLLIDNTVLVGSSGGALDVSGNANQASLSQSVEEVDVTAFSDLARRRVGSLGDGSFSLRSFLDDAAAEPWAQIRGQLASDAYIAWIESNASMAEEDAAAFGKFLQVQQDAGGAVGEAHMIEVSGSQSEAVIVGGKVLQQDESLTVTGNSTGFQFGALAAGEKMYAALFALATTAGTLDAKIVSDDNSGFTSATDRITFTQVTTSTITLWGSVAGAVTDDWWRFEYTIATGPYTVVCLIGKL